MTSDQIHEVIGNQATEPEKAATTRMCQVNFKSGNRMSGMLSAGAGDRYRLLAPAQTAGADGKPQEAIAEHHFDLSDVEAIVVLYPVEKKISLLT